jgi:hypothetical protein
LRITATFLPARSSRLDDGLTAFGPTTTKPAAQYGLREVDLQRALGRDGERRDHEIGTAGQQRRDARLRRDRHDLQSARPASSPAALPPATS